MDYISIALKACVYGAIWVVCGIFLLIIGFICFNGIWHLDLNLFALTYNSENLSLFPAIINTLSMVFFALLITLPLGILGAIFLGEYCKETNRFVKLVNVASTTLVGIPSICYGLFGYLAFVIYFGFKTSMVAGILTLSIMILPLILTSTQEALKATPLAYREASFALGAGKLRTIFSVVLPAAIGGILSGVILGIGKIVGESAALLYTSGTVAKVAGALDSGRSLSVHLYVISSEGLHLDKAYASAMILIVIVLFLNFISNLVVKKIKR